MALEDVFPYDHVIEVTGCRDEDVDRVFEEVRQAVSRGAKRFLVRLKGVRLEDCLPLVRKLTGHFISCGFLIREEPR